MAAEIFTLGARDFRLPGLGAYLQTAANAENLPAIGYGIATLIVVIVLLDQLIWRPLLVWADRFKLEMVESDNPPQSWFYDLLQHATLKDMIGGVVAPVGRTLDALFDRLLPLPRATSGDTNSGFRIGWLFLALIGAAAVAGTLLGGRMLIQVSPEQWLGIGIGLGATFLRVVAALAIALIWTVPLGVYIGMQPRAAAVLQPIIQIVASVPATALFPVLVLALLSIPGGLNIAAVLLMLLGTQWYVLFNVIAGASAIPQDLRYTTESVAIERMATLAHAYPARSVSLPDHRDDHRQRRRMECQHCCRICGLRRANVPEYRRRRPDHVRHRRWRLSTPAGSHAGYGDNRRGDQSPRLATPLSTC